jgi:hypothetical protein
MELLDSLQGWCTDLACTPFLSLTSVSASELSSWLLFGCCFRLNRVVFAGGEGGGTTAVSLYDTSTQTFSAGPSMSSPRYGKCGYAVDNYFVMASGTGTAEVYNASTNGQSVSVCLSVFVWSRCLSACLRLFSLSTTSVSIRFSSSFSSVFSFVSSSACVPTLSSLESGVHYRQHFPHCLCCVRLLLFVLTAGLLFFFFPSSSLPPPSLPFFLPFFLSFFLSSFLLAVPAGINTLILPVVLIAAHT